MSDRRSPSAATDTDALLREIVARLERIEVALTAKPRHMPKSPGRKRNDDVDALAEVHRLIEAGCEEWQAVKSVAIALGGKTKAHQQRLGRKLRDGSQS